jgi:hypothetical protein
MNQIQCLMLKFPRDVREKVVARGGFRKKPGTTSTFVCADGLCVWGALLLDNETPAAYGINGHEHIERTPTIDHVSRKLINLGISRTGHEATVRALMEMNDHGMLADPDAVRALLLPEDA